MFLVTQQQSPAFSQEVILKDDSTKTEVVILPACGAVLYSFTVLNNGRAMNIIESYDSDADFAANAESKGFRNIKMSPFACRVKNAQYRFNGANYTIQKFLLNGSAIHGLLYNEPFTVSNTWASEKTAGVSLYVDYKGTDAGYPFSFRCEVTYELQAGNALTLSTTVINKDKNNIPLMDGWHPYFSFGGTVNELQLQFNSDNLVEFDDALVPTGKLIPYTDFNTAKQLGDTFFDNCFTLKKGSTGPACILKDEQQQLQLEIFPDNHYPYLQIYTPPHRKSIAIENISGAPDAFNNGMGLLLLQPETTAQFATTYKITSQL
jgi:aldose 1-epimerase